MHSNSRLPLFVQLSFLLIIGINSSNARLLHDVLKEARVTVDDGIFTGLIENVTTDQLNSFRIDEDNNTLLIYAVKIRNSALVQLLLSLGADPSLTNKDGTTPLLLANDTASFHQLLNYSRDSIDSTLISAASRGNHMLVRYLLEAGADVNFQDPSSNNNTALITAIRKGRNATVAVLLGARAAPALVNSFGLTALQYAADQGNLDILNQLLEHGAPINARRTNSNFTALDFAAANNDVAAMRVLLNAGAEYNGGHGTYPTLIAVATYNATNAVRLLLSIGANVNVRNSYGDTALGFASKFGYLEIVNLLLDHNADFLSTENNGMTALLTASFLNQIETADLLIKRGADMHAKSGQGFNALHIAVLKEHLGMIKLLLDRGIDTEALDDDGMTALMLAVTSNKYASAQLLIERGANLEASFKDVGTPLIAAVRIRGNLDMINLLLDHNASTNAQNSWGEDIAMEAVMYDRIDVLQLLSNRSIKVDFNKKNINGNSLVALAVGNGFADVLKSLYEAGADINSKNKGGNTSLMWAASNGSLKFVKLLIEYGSAINQLNNSGDSALGMAAFSGQRDIVEYLLDNGAEIDSRNNAGDSAFTLAASAGHNEATVYLLLQRGAFIHTRNKNGDTALMKAAGSGDLDVVKMLVNRGANIHATNNNGDNAVMASARHGYTLVIEFLLTRGAQLDIVNNLGYTPLMAATMNNHNDTVAFLLMEKNDTLEARSSSCETALNIAAKQGFGGIVRMLVDFGASVNTSDNLGRTPLINAVNNSFMPIAAYLLKQQADVNARESMTGRSALVFAAANGNAGLVRLLLNNTAKVDFVDARGRTPLLEAVAGNHLDVVGLLLEAGANINLKDPNGVTALLLASWSGHSEIVQHLFQHGATKAGCPICFF